MAGDLVSSKQPCSLQPWPFLGALPLLAQDSSGPTEASDQKQGSLDRRTPGEVRGLHMGFSCPLLLRGPLFWWRLPPRPSPAEGAQGA